MTEVRLPKGTLVATLKTPIPVNADLIGLTNYLQAYYGVKLVLMPFSAKDSYVRVEVA